MKNIIVRTPETDRKLVEIPERLGDLRDPDGVSIVEVVGLARLIAGTEVSGSLFRDTPAAFPFDDWPLMRNVTVVEGGFTVTAAGLYMVNVNVDWVTGGTIPAPDPPPIAAARLSAVIINDSAEQYLLDKADYTVGTSKRGRDSGTFTLPLEAGDSVKVYLSWASSIDPTTNGGDIERAWLSLYRLP